MFGINIDIHLLKLNFKILARQYKFQTNGGRIFLLTMLIELVAKHFGYINCPFHLIFIQSMCACLAWDLVTLALFGLKILWLSKKNRYLLEVPGGDAETTNFLFLDTTAAGKGLLIFETKHKGELFIKQFANQFPQLENVILRKVSLSNINSFLDAEDFKGCIEFDGKEINFFPFNNEV